MKLKTFGLIEATIGSAIIIVFIVGMGFIAVKSDAILQETIHRQEAQKISRDFFARLFLLKNLGKINFDDTTSFDSVSINCFATNLSSQCEGKVMDAYPQNQAPFFNMVSSEKVGDFNLFKSEYLAEDNINADFYKIKTEVKKVDCSTDEKLTISKDKCRNVHLEIIWIQPNGQKALEANQFISQL